MAKKNGENAAADDAHEDQAAVATVRMVRDEPQHPGGPITADVHPDEVPNYTAHDWRVAKD